MAKFPISRRTVLRGAGAALGLPWLEAMKLEAMTPQAQAAARTKTGSPKRMVAMYMPNGVHPDMWTPAGVGRDFQLSPTLAPLEDLKSEIVVMTNLWNQASRGGDGHYVKISGFLTCTTITKTLGVDINCNGVSVDQIAARQIGKQTPLPSLELGITPVSTGVDRNVGYTRVYGSHIAWSGPTMPLAREVNPRLVFERLFRAGGPQGNTAKQDVALLDGVMDEARQLSQSLGQADRHRLDEYLTVVRSLEERLERASRPEQSSWKPKKALDPAQKPAGLPKDHAEHVRLMMDMIALAFQSDTTRIATFMFGNEVSNTNFAFLDGVKGAHHSISHHMKEADALRQYQLINKWHIEQYAYLLRKLRDMKEGDQSILDNSMVLFGAGIRDGDKHDPHNLPVVLAGRCGGRIATNRHLVYSPDSPLANVYVSMLDAFDTPVERFADSTGKAVGLLA
ncbi:MAG: DUF1552 domain-containing protein [Bryobacterales bacterium]|nr:DUF1552 domain-containing protein [Bryobacterales bacterium]